MSNSKKWKMSDKHKHLDYIQAVVTRMANNSFLLKGWTVTLCSATFVVLDSSEPFHFISIIMIPLIVFWILDGYYLWQERLYRGLYNSVIKKSEDDIDFSMRPLPTNKNTWIDAVFSKTLILFYISILIVSSLAVYYSVIK